VVRREDERRVPVEAVPLRAHGAARADEAALAGAKVAAAHRPALTLGVDDIGIIRIDAAGEAVAAVDGEPVLHDNPAARRERPAAPRAVVLQAAEDAVVRPRVDRDVVELAECLEVVMVPVLAAVIANVKPAVGTNDDVPAVARVNPQSVVIAVDPAILAGLEAFPAVGRISEADAADVDVSIILRIDADEREVHRPQVEAVDGVPGVARVVRAIDAAGLPAVLALLILDIRLLAAEAAAVGPLARRAAPASAAGEELRDVDLGQGQLEVELLLAAEDRQLHLVAGLLVAGGFHHEFAEVVDGLAISAGDDVVDLQAGLGGRAVLDDGGDLQAFLGVLAAEPGVDARAAEALPAAAALPTA